jgi:alkanesulfonate monooxygenase SsuD/methylene tetrahydromethanopterin reductase-like flavin-dependent oxidoreductase (luciferase family)
MEKANAGEPIRYEGEYHDIEIKGWARPHPAVRDKVPIYVAAVGEGMARMAGDVADGALGHIICSTRWLSEVMIPNFEKGLARSGRERSDFDYIPGACVAIARDDSEVEAAYDAARRTLAFYATVRTYAPVFELDGFGSEAEAVGNAFRAGDLAGVAAAVTDEMVACYCAVGTVDKVREKVAEIAAHGDAVSVGPPTYFIPNEEIAEYQRRALETFGPANR